MTLTDTAIRKTKTDPKRTIKLSDGGGLQLWVQPSGARLWNLAYRFNGKQRKLAIGPYPTVGLKDARERREAAKRLLIEGRDPSLQKRLDKITAQGQQGNTFEAISRELIDKKKEEGRAAATLTKVAWLIEIANPILGPRPVAEISAPEILHVLKQVQARGKHETAQRLRAVIGEVFRFAVATGRAETDPTLALRGALIAPKVAHRAAITEPAEFGVLLRAIDGHLGTPEVRIALQLLALTFVRPGELRHAEWNEFDFQKAVWIIPGPRMKMRHPHRVPLAKQTIQHLQALKAFTGHGALLFPGAHSSAKPLSENTFNAALRRLGFGKDEMTGHGFRAAASSMLNESGKWNPDAIEAQLAHLDSNSVRRAYARAEFWDERVLMMADWADRLDAMRKGAEIVQQGV